MQWDCERFNVCTQRALDHSHISPVGEFLTSYHTPHYIFQIQTLAYLLQADVVLL